MLNQVQNLNSNKSTQKSTFLFFTKIAADFFWQHWFLPTLMNDIAKNVLRHFVAKIF